LAKEPEFYIACACIAFSREVMKLKEKWPIYLEKIAQIKFREFQSSYELVKEYFKNKL